MNRDTETVPARHETPDVAELRQGAERCASDPDFPHDGLGRLVRALPALLDDADALRAEVKRLTALVELVREWIDRRGVNVDSRDDDYMDGYRAAQRHALLDAVELRDALDGGVQ